MNEMKNEIAFQYVYLALHTFFFPKASFGKVGKLKKTNSVTFVDL